MTQAALQPEPRFSVGQPVRCIMFDGIWAVSRIIEINYGVVRCFRYEISQHDIYEMDIVEIWLDPVRLKFPSLQIVN